jgi:hypothetical protein
MEDKDKKFQQEFCYNTPPFNGFIISSLIPEIIAFLAKRKHIITLEHQTKNAKQELKDFFDQVCPEEKIYFLETPAYTWLKESNFNREYKYNLHIGRNKKDLEDFDKIYKNLKIEKNIGKYLSYPDCCVEAFVKDKGRKFNEAFAPLTVNKIDWRLNNFFIRSAVSCFLFRHYVCSYECQETIQYSQDIADYLRENYKDLYNHLKKISTLPLLNVYMDKEPTIKLAGIGSLFIFKGEYKDENTLEYEEVFNLSKDRENFHNPQEEKKIYNELEKGNKIKISDKKVKIYKNEQFQSEITQDNLVFIWPL